MFLGLFFLFLIVQSVVGHSVCKDEQLTNAAPVLSYPRYLFSSHFGEAVSVNWESEFLQMAAFVLLIVFMTQSGSDESASSEQKREGKHPRDRFPSLGTN